MKRLNLNKDNMVVSMVAVLGLIFLMVGVFLNNTYVDTLFIGAGITLMLAIAVDFITKIVSNKINV